ncbi:hypothetical protein AA0113_g9620 [Alternaria arborescens]|uniref:Uncharacterized protein n=1 Tax=Alternaria arborescens TaxID=156630 RepID=A0A4Q4R6M4_9PLEO|nr:hypothetical protein AA0113_g9620 [Alternaria arborescens]
MNNYINPYMGDHGTPNNYHPQARFGGLPHMPNQQVAAQSVGAPGSVQGMPVHSHAQIQSNDPRTLPSQQQMRAQPTSSSGSACGVLPWHHLFHVMTVLHNAQSARMNTQNGQQYGPLHPQQQMMMLEEQHRLQQYHFQQYHLQQYHLQQHRLQQHHLQQQRLHPAVPQQERMLHLAAPQQQQYQWYTYTQPPQLVLQEQPTPPYSSPALAASNIATLSDELAAADATMPEAIPTKKARGWPKKAAPTVLSQEPITEPTGQTKEMTSSQVDDADEFDHLPSYFSRSEESELLEWGLQQQAKNRESAEKWSAGSYGESTWDYDLFEESPESPWNYDLERLPRCPSPVGDSMEEV